MIKQYFKLSLLLFLVSCGNADRSNSSYDRYPTYSSPTGSSTSYESSGAKIVVDIAHLFIDHPFLKILKAIFMVSEANAKMVDHENKILEFKTGNNVTGQVDLSQGTADAKFKTRKGEVINFSAAEFVKANNVTEIDEIALQELANKIYDDYLECTSLVLETKIKNYIEDLRLRTSCLINKGYTHKAIAINSDYMKIRGLEIEYDN